jgi:hypothetical protein
MGGVLVYQSITLTNVLVIKAIQDVIVLKVNSNKNIITGATS